MSANAALYDHDFYAWTQTTADLLRPDNGRDI